ncbi:insulinase family protein [Pseudoprevotella muciniphila]|uniref:Insulinase family protein n=1 Tax=Pseudoprevotella muciniphila TaxID=2133944 RepID=A0A5P8E6Y4_9BACT|nr:insulinase family protein [Pseudoprevotella muciniphila]QFQ12698.1 insulinase family protein [Pseudoprevotella muciniphila]
MKKLFILLLMLPFMAVQAQQLPEVPNDPEVRIGKLENGLTYYIRHNNLPENQACFYIAQRVGSVQEEESQRGLAHFLEHMAFNGTTSFPGNNMINYLESIGINFGGELNAYTGADETVYNIDAVPVTPGHIDSCLLILHDWSNSLLLEDAEIDKERGVIHEEWRLRSSAMMRMLERNLETIYPNSRYGRRFPIGLMEVIDNFAPDTLRAYYHRWYRPELQGIVVVGDIDVAEVEQKVKNLFSDIKNPENPSPYLEYEVPDNETPIYVIDKDKEQTIEMIMVSFKQDPMPRELRKTMAKPLQDFIVNVITMALNKRFDELSQQEDCPFNEAGCDYGTYIMSKTKDAFNVNIMPKPGKSAEALKVVMQELERAHRFGLTGSEVIRAREEIMSAKEAQYNNREKQYNNHYVQKFVRSYLDGTPASNIETEYQILQMVAPQLPAETYSELVKEMVASTDTNFVVLAFYPEKEGVVMPTQEELRNAVSEAKAAQLEAYVDNVKNEPLIATLPAPGSITKEEPSKFGYTKWTLSNGANVYFKHTDHNLSSVSLSARSEGGLRRVKQEDLLNAKNTATFMNSSGLGNFKNLELEKALAGKQVSLSSNIAENTEVLIGSSTPKDLRTLFEMVYLTFTQPGYDADNYKKMLGSMRTQLENADKVPESALSDSLISTLFKNNAYVKPTKLADLDNLDYDAMQRIFRERFNSAGDFDFYVTGNFDADSLRLFTEQYIASLPGVNQREARGNEKVDMVKGTVMNRFTRKMETPKSYIFQIWNGEEPYSMKEAAIVDALGQILSQRYLKSIREEGSMAYSVQASGSADFGIKDEYSLSIICPVKPEKADSALILIRQGIEEIAKDGVTKEELDKVITYNVKSYQDNQKNNGYWAGLISSYVNWNKDTQTGYIETQQALTSKDIQDFVKKVLLKQNNCATVLMLPEE